MRERGRLERANRETEIESDGKRLKDGVNTAK